jgi:Bacterial Ig-like domain (group 3)
LTVPTGSVTFKQGNEILGTVALANGQAIFITTLGKAGTFSIVGSYSGDQNYLPKNSKPVKRVVNK